VALIATWIARTTWRLFDWRVPAAGQQRETSVSWLRWTAITGLACCVVAGGVAWKPLIHRLADASHSSSPPALTWASAAAVAPALLAIVALAGWRWLFGRREDRATAMEREQMTVPGQTTRSEQVAYGLQEGLTRAAKVLHSVIETGIQERVLVTIVRTAIGIAQWIHRVMERQLLERALRYAVQVIVDVGQLAYRFVEHKSLENGLRQIVRAVLALNRRLQRLHTGNLRYNLIWATLALGAAILILVLI
jgi:hypothetical protein